MNFSKTIISWYKKNKRDLPWRKTKDPYKIWLSEIILQQTRVAQGYDYYVQFIENFPTVKQLAAADEDTILKLWQGLGYYSRARNLHTAAKMVIADFKGKFPKKYDDVIQLKGVGEYTAAAVSSFANNEAKAVIDGNVYRVLSRVFGIETPIDATQGKKEFKELANKLLDVKNAGLHNQAIMEFGALQCKPQKPDCGNCPLQYNCIANEKGLQKELPKKEKKIKVRNRYFNYLYIQQGSHTYINKRTEKDIWINLFELPLIETKKQLSLNELVDSEQWKNIFGTSEIQVKNVSKEYKHKLSHQNLHTQFITLTIPHKTNIDFIKIPQSEIHRYAIPKLIDLFLSLLDA